MRTVGVLFHAVDIGLHTLVFVDMADAVEAHFVVARRTDHPLA